MRCMRLIVCVYELFLPRHVALLVRTHVLALVCPHEHARLCAVLPQE